MRSLFSDVHQIGIVVKNVKETIKRYSDIYGIGPWNVWEFNSSVVKDMSVNGKKVNYRMLVATCKSFNVDWELIEPLDEKSIYYDFLNTRGEGLHHINYIIKDFNFIVNYFKKNNIPVTQYGNLQGKHIYAYYDTEADAKHIIEISANLGKFKRTDPLLTYPVMKNKFPEVRPFFNRIEQIVIVVNDIISTKKVLENKYLITPWKLQISKKSESINHNNLNYAITKFNSLAIKIFERNKKHSPIFENIEKNYEGLHHIIFSVDDLEKTSKRLSQFGIEIKFSEKVDSKELIYFSTEKDLKFCAGCF